MAFPIYFPWPVFMFQIRLCVYYSLWIMIQTKHNKLDFKSHRNSSTLNDSRANWVWLQHITVILKVLRRDISLASQFCGPLDRNTTTKTKNKCVWVQNLTNWNIAGMNELNVFPFSLKIWWPMLPRTRPPMTSQNLLNLSHHSAPGFLLTRSWIYRLHMWRHQARKQYPFFTSDPISTPESLPLAGQPLTEEP